MALVFSWSFGGWFVNLVRFFFSMRWLEQRDFLSSIHTTIALALFKGLRLLVCFHKNECFNLVFLSANWPIVHLDKGGGYPRLVSHSSILRDLDKVGAANRGVDSGVTFCFADPLKVSKMKNNE